MAVRLTLEFILAYVYDRRWLDNLGGEVVDHGGGWIGVIIEREY